MLEWFTEDSTVPMVAGILLTIIFLCFWISSREKMMAKIALLIAFLTFSTVLCETMIVTQEEEVTETIYELAALVQRNETKQILGYISEVNPETSRQADREMKQCQFDSCFILGKKYFESHSETSTEICFVVTASGTRSGFSGTARREVTLHFQKEKGRWVIVDFSHRDPLQGMSL